MPNSVTKYIEAVSETEFGIFVQVDASSNYPEDNIKATVRLDNHWMAACTVRALASRPHGTNDWLLMEDTVRKKEEEGGQPTWWRQKFAFSKLNIVDEPMSDTPEEVQEQIADLGCINVQLHRVGDKSGHPTKGSGASNASNIGTIPEKALKGRALSHRAGFGRLAPTREPRGGKKRKYLDGHSHPIATFNFKYRSMEALQSLCIVPRASSPVPAEQRPLEELSVEELRYMVGRERERNPAAYNVKPERQGGVKRERASTRAGTTVDDDEVSFVEERPIRRQRVSDENENRIEIIDLT